MEVHQIEIEFGSINSIEDLAMAYEQIGFSPTEALEKAEQVSLIVQLLEAFQKHTLNAINIEDIQNTSGILQANEHTENAAKPKIRMTEVKQTAIAFTATINISPRTDFVDKAAAKIPLLKDLKTEGLIKASNTPLTEEILLNDDGVSLDALFPQEAVPFASLQTMLNEVIPAQQVKVAEFASAVAEEEVTKPIAQKSHAKPAVLTMDATNKGIEVAQGKVPTAEAELPILQDEAVEQVTVKTVTDTVEHQQKQATPVLRPAVENSLANKESRGATQSSFANHNGAEVRNVNAPAPVAGKPVIQMQPNETGELQIIDSASGEQVEMEAEELRFSERVERNIATAKHNNGLAKVAERAQVAEQINVQVKNLVTKGGGHIRMTLNPAELGQVDIQLQITDGKVQGTILAQNLEVIEQMARDLRSLQQGLAEAGLELDTKGIQFQLREENESSNQQASGNRANGENHLEQELEIETEMTSNWTDPDKIIDVSI
jgi:flagellar hook-length control protein FliK